MLKSAAVQQLKTLYGRNADQGFNATNEAVQLVEQAVREAGGPNQGGISHLMLAMFTMSAQNDGRPILVSHHTNRFI
jgi:hypothetical protein